MRHTIDLSEVRENALRRLAGTTGHSADALLRGLAEMALLSNIESRGATDRDVTLSVNDKTVVLEFKSSLDPIRTTEGVMGGDVCVRNTRIPVWMLVGYKQAGFTDESILRNFPDLSAADLTAAWDYFATNSERVLTERIRHEESE